MPIVPPEVEPTFPTSLLAIPVTGTNCLAFNICFDGDFLSQVQRRLVAVWRTMRWPSYRPPGLQSLRGTQRTVDEQSSSLTARLTSAASPIREGS